MAKLQITEYGGPGVRIPSGSLKDAPLAVEPAVAEQEVTFTTATQSSAFNADTVLVRLVADADCRVKFGNDPTAVAASQRLIANVPEWRAVGAGHKVSVYDGSS